VTEKRRGLEKQAYAQSVASEWLVSLDATARQSIVGSYLFPIPNVQSRTTFSFCRQKKKETASVFVSFVRSFVRSAINNECDVQEVGETCGVEGFERGETEDQSLRQKAIRFLYEVTPN
jgi:hypothetical protein